MNPDILSEPTPPSASDGWERSASAAPPVEVGAVVRRALFGRDLIGPAPGLWPWGSAARTRRTDRRRIAAEAARRRQQVRRAVEEPDHLPAAISRQRPDEPRQRFMAAALLVATALLVMVLGWLSTRTQRHRLGVSRIDAVTVDPIPAYVTGSHTDPRPGDPIVSTAVSLQPASPASRLVPAAAPTETEPLDPATVQLVDPPTSAPTAGELSSPESAAVAWLARWCSFTTSEAFGTAENRARIAMTAAGWAQFDPASNARAHASWEQSAALGESGRCAAATARVSPEAPRTDIAVIVTVSTIRVVTASDRGSYVEQVEQTRKVLRGADGTWRVDLPADGG